MKSLTKVIVIVHAFYVFRARLRRRPLPRARPTVGVARRTAPHRDAFEMTIARMGIFDDVFGARARRAGGTKTTNATNASSLFASSSEFRAETEGSGTRARRPSATTTARATTTTTTGKRRRKSADDDERRASSSEEEDEEKDGRAVAAVGQRIKIFWDLEEQWFEGTVAGHDANTGRHLIRYDDGEDWELLLEEEKY